MHMHACMWPASRPKRNQAAVGAGRGPHQHCHPRGGGAHKPLPGPGHGVCTGRLYDKFHHSGDHAIPCMTCGHVNALPRVMHCALQSVLCRRLPPIIHLESCEAMSFWLLRCTIRIS
eukprot:244132-Chlamydomonas_euryale.AAC.19